MSIDQNQDEDRRRFDHVDAQWAMERGWASAPVLAAILEQIGGRVVLDPEVVERHLANGTTPRFLVEDSPRRRLSARLPNPSELPGPPPVFDPCPTCGRVVTRIADLAAQPCGHRVTASKLSDGHGPDRYVLRAVADHSVSRHRSRRR